ncbi:MAG: fatty acid desaturase, partial [Solirubrobacterales bacterium]|nr:fatty acid desaturase [Solirubrobacterales bacterium]
GFLAAVILLWRGFGGWRQLALMGALYLLTGIGLTVGFHRLLAHRAFATCGWMRCALAVLGSMAVEGPVISWVANHRKHHAYADQPGDPHSPHLSDGDSIRAALAGLFHAHLGWILTEPTAERSRYARDLLADRSMRIIDRLFALWVLLTLLVPALLGWAITGTLTGALSGLLFGGLARVFLLHHVTFSINSLCHFLGSRKFATRDESRNVGWLAPISFGEAWHHNHHAFPTSAFHGLRRWEFDPGRAVIRGLERVGLAWDVVRVDSERQRAKLLEDSSG